MESMTNSVSQRRDNMNNIFITLNLAIIHSDRWILNIRNNKLLNTAKSRHYSYGPDQSKP